MLVVDRFDAAWPGLTCERARADSEFENTYWRIASLDGMALTVVDGNREPHVIFRTEEGAFAATVGCNQMNGGFERTGDSSLSLRPGAMTMMACPPPLDTAERQMVDVFGRTAGFRILGPTMALLDADGVVIAHLEAVYLP
jgi:putative lipoprotein